MLTIYQRSFYGILPKLSGQTRTRVCLKKDEHILQRFTWFLYQINNLDRFNHLRGELFYLLNSILVKLYDLARHGV